ncbi:MAG: cation diffusion facilitator family transporter [Pseudoxanthomonas sp.]
MDTRPEQRLLKLSILVTLIVGAVGVGGGLLTRSQAIMFDGMYSLVDVVLTTGSLVVSRLVSLEGSRRFQYGYWHLEPMVETFGGAVLVLSCIYAAINAINGLMTGGHEVAYGFGAIWAGILCMVGMGMAFYMRRNARRLQSALLAMDFRSWMVSGFLSMALLIGFGIALAIQGTQFEGWIPYLDSLILLCISLAMMLVPMASIWSSAREVLRVAPSQLDEQVKATMPGILAEHGFLDYTSQVAKVGRARFIELHILVPRGYNLGSIEHFDRIRRTIAERLGAQSPEFWLTIEFTSDPSWL